MSKAICILVFFSKRLCDLFNIGCCIYSKPKIFGDSSSESDSDDEGCHHNAYCTGHKKKGHRGHHGDNNIGDEAPEPSSQSGSASNT